MKIEPRKHTPDARRAGGLSIASAAVFILAGCGVAAPAQDPTHEVDGAISDSAAAPSEQAPTEQTTNERAEQAIREGVQKFLAGRSDFTEEELGWMREGVGAALDVAELEPRTRDFLVRLQEALSRCPNHGATQPKIAPAIAAALIAVIATALSAGVSCYRNARNCELDAEREHDRCMWYGRGNSWCCYRAAIRAAEQCGWSCGTTRPSAANFNLCI